MKKLHKLLLCAAPLIANVQANDLAFDFSRNKGDRQHYFGTHLPSNLFDQTSVANSFMVQANTLKVTSTSSAICLLNDADPDKVNPKKHTGDPTMALNDFEAKTILSQLSSGENAVEAQAGYVIGYPVNAQLNGQAYVATFSRVPGKNLGKLTIASLKDDKLDQVIGQSTEIKWPSSSSVFLLSISIEGKDCSVQLFEAKKISVEKTDLESLKNADISTQKPLLRIDSKLPEYIGGYTGLFFNNNSTSKKGGVQFNNFVLSSNNTKSI